MQYEVDVDWANLPAHTNTVEGIPDSAVSLRFRREKNSHRGISRLKALRQLVAFCVNQECLEEIAELSRIETLYICQTTADNLECLARCRSLRHLIIEHGTRIPSLEWVTGLPLLESLRFQHLKLVRDLSPVGSLRSLRAFGCEGSTWATQRVDSFEPVSHLPYVNALFFTNCHPKTDGLRPLHMAKDLRYLEVAAFFPDEDFLALRRARPGLECPWFDLIDKHGTIKAAVKSLAE
ncbi:MAG: hypothetical protein ABFC96_13090 [Thermoguttaceae bacterium]